MVGTSVIAILVLFASQPAWGRLLLLDDVKNMRLECPGKDGIKVALRNGEGEDDDGSMSSNVKVGRVAFSDLDGDGNRDAAVELVVERGASGWFATLAVVLGGERPACAASRELGEDTEFGTVAITQIRTDGSAIIVSELVHGPDEPHCCPSVLREETFEFANGEIRRVGKPRNLGKTRRPR